MNDRFSYRVTICVPEALINDANQLALCLGTTAADVGTFGELWTEDATGNRYTYAHTPVSAAWLAGVGAALSAPAFAPDADLAAAGRAQAALVQHSLASAQPAQTTQITAVIGPNEINQIGVHLGAVGLGY
jgi:hypothetical protein